MTDYSVWIYAMLAVGALITAAVVYTLSQPSDLPYLKKTEDCFVCCRPILIQTQVYGDEVSVEVTQEDLGF